MKGLNYIPTLKAQNFKLLLLFGFLSIAFCNCINDEKIKNYRVNGEVQHLKLIEQMESNYQTKLDTLEKENF